MDGRMTADEPVTRKGQGIWVVTRENNSRPMGTGVFCCLLLFLYRDCLIQTIHFTVKEGYYGRQKDVLYYNANLLSK